MKPKRRGRYYKDEETLKLIGSKIREFRMSKGISQEDLANECGLEYSQVNRIELGKINFGISNLFRIARTLNVDPKEFL